MKYKDVKNAYLGTLAHFQCENCLQLPRFLYPNALMSFWGLLFHPEFDSQAFWPRCNGETFSGSKTRGTSNNCKTDNSCKSKQHLRHYAKTALALPLILLLHIKAASSFLPFLPLLSMPKSSFASSSVVVGRLQG